MREFIRKAKQFLLWLYIDWLSIRHRLLIAQYGDTSYGDDVRMREEERLRWVRWYQAHSVAPTHAGCDWQR